MGDYQAPNTLPALFAEYVALRHAERTFAVASVVHVDGSAFRREGARMLVVPAPDTDFSSVTDDPITWGGVPRPRRFGTISGGCLEGEVSYHALNAVRTEQARIITLVSHLGGDDRTAFEVGCGGSVQVLVQPVLPTRPGPLDAAAAAGRRTGVLAVVTRAGGGSPYAPSLVGTGVYVDEAGRVERTIGCEAICSWLTEQALAALADGKGRTVRSRESKYPSLGIEARIDVLRPPIHLVVCGTGPDARALVRQARLLGWETTVVGAEAAPDILRAIPEGDHALAANNGAALRQGLHFDARTAVVVMTHNFDRDCGFVAALTVAPVPYLGLLGSRRRTGRLVSTLTEAGVRLRSGRLRSPVGLDIGAETPEEIALATCAEIVAHFRRDHSSDPSLSSSRSVSQLAV